MMEFNGHKVWKLQVLWGKQHGVIFIPSNQKLFIERAEKLMPKWESITGLKSSSWFIDKSKTSWGWCETSSGKIMLNENLIYKPKECLEYVILHELCHLNQANHGPRFVALLNQYMPSWRELEILNNGTLPTYSKYE